MACPSCGADNPTEDRFCGQCGSALPAPCAACGRANPASNRFCGGCGAPLGDAPPMGAPDSEHPGVMPGDRIPRHLAEKILANRAALEGERKQVTVLFADIVGSTELIRDRDPEEAQALLDGAITRMMAAVHRYEGTVSRLMGDGLMAMFGAPVAHEDHAVRACYAALAMLEAVREYADEARRAHGVAIQVRVGINSGQVVVRLISDDLHMDYTAMGQTVHLASRMEGLADAGTALLSPSTLALAEGFIDVRPLGPTTVKGLERPVEVYELTGTGTVRTRLQASAARGLTPFVGRQEERAAIHRALARVRAGHGQVVALVAEAGVGKSRLAWEATHSDQASGFTVLQTGAVSYGQATAWLPVSDLLRRYFEIESRDDHGAMRAKVVGGVEALDSALAPDLPALLSLLDLPVDDDAWTALDPPRRRAATLDALRRLVLRESRGRPLLLVFEDLHWIDAETQALLDGLVEALPTARILLLVNYRPEYTHGWGNRSYYTQLRIAPFEQASAEEMLDGLLGHDPTVLPLKEVLVSRTEGNPFFLEESVRSLVEVGALIGVRGAHRLVHTVENIHVPATVQAVLAARIDRLPPEEKRLLQTASVIGKDVPFALLDAVSDVPNGDLRDGLSRLQAAELLYAISLYPEPEYTFKHALTQEVAYGGLLQEPRRSIHGRIVAAIESLHPDRRGEHVERLARHSVGAEDWEKAAAYGRLAGQRALARSAVQEAMGYLEQAVDAVDRLPDTPERKERAIDLRFELRAALRLGGDDAGGLQRLWEAEALAEASGDRRRLAWADAHLAATLWMCGAHHRAIDLARRSAVIADALGDVTLQNQAYSSIGLPLWGLGRYRESAEHFRKSLGFLPEEQLGVRITQQTHIGGVMAMANLAWSLAELGAFDEARLYEQRANRLAERSGSPVQVASAYNRTSNVALLQGDAHRTIAGLESMLELCRAREQPFLTMFAAGALGAAYVAVSRAGEAMPLLKEAIEHVRAGRAQAEGSRWLGWLGEALLADGRPVDALRVAEEALVGTLSRHERGNEARIRYLLGLIAARGDPPDTDQAEHQHQEALALAVELEMRPLQAHCHLGLGKLYRRLGRPEEARAELATAISMLREMGMAHWLPEAERELANVGGAGPLSER